MYGPAVHQAALAKGGKGDRRHSALCERGVRRRPHPCPAGGGGAARRYPETLQKRVMEQAEWKLLPAALAQVCEEYDK